MKTLLFLLLWSWTLQPAWALDTSLPEIGDPSGTYLSTHEERELGRAFMRSVRANTKLVKDPILNGYLQLLGDRLASKAGMSSGSLTFFFVDNPMINAFAGPGGYIGVHTGLVLEAKTESELAAVIAHEIAHVSQRHVARMVQEIKQSTLPLAALTLVAILLGAAGQGQAAAVTTAGGQALITQKFINFTRANEREADNIGMQILSDSRYDPHAMATFFQRLGRTSDSGGIALPEFLRTHPVSANRTADALARAEKYPYKQNPDDFDFQLARNAIRVKSFSSGKSAVRHFASTLRDGRYRSESAERYGYVLALQRTRSYSAARQELNKLLQKHNNNSVLRAASAKLYLDQGNRGRAVTTAKQALAIRPGNYALTLFTADIMLKARQPKVAYSILKKLARNHEEDPQVLKLLSRAAAGSGNDADSHAALAEYYYASGELDTAIRQLLIALKLSGLSFYSKSKLEARIRDIKAEQRALKQKH